MNLKPQTLFNQSVIKKLCSQIKLTDLQKQSALEWIKMIENNQLGKEQENQNEFEDYILHNILGYEIRECKREKLDIDYSIDLPGSTKSLCIEVKGTKTKNLFKDQKRKDDSKFNPVIQLYTYMGHGYDYGVVTNYNDFILLTQNTQLVKAQEFDFLSIKKTEDRIDENKLKEFILLFSKKEVFVNNSIEELGNQTILSEQEFTDEFYKLFHETRLMLIKEFEESSNVPHDVAIYYSQIFLNRLIFIYFVEDHNFIPSSLFEKRILGILQSPSIDESTHLIFDDVMGLFKIMNIGSKVHGVNGFNGGLFGDNIPSNIVFSDLRNTDFFTECYKNSNLKLKSTVVDIAISGIYAEKLSPLIKNLLIMASHDFTSDLDVDILGRIFEQSISDIELLKENETSKRKKDGVFYTPDYITDYICRNTIIPYLSKTEKNSVIDLVDEYSENLAELETKLKNLKILDPACGSGAFLVKAVDVLLEIDEEIQLRKPKKISSQSGMDEFTKIKDINLFIENNIYGVDINPASVEITKLSLFLKLAGPESKLGYLSNNIKVGNSLISDKKIVKNAFSWETEFPEVMGFEKFDIIIGNPPYLRIQGLHENHESITNFIKNNFKSATGHYDYYILFIEKSLELLKKNGHLSFITPHKFTNAVFGKGIRKILSQNKLLAKFLNFGHNFVFKDVTTYTGILTLKNKINETFLFHRIDQDIPTKKLEMYLQSMRPKDFVKIESSKLSEAPWSLHTGIKSDILEKINNTGNDVLTYFDKILQGVVTGDDSIYLLKLIKNKGSTSILFSSKTNSEIEIENELLKPILFGKDVKRNKSYEKINYFLLHPHKIESDTQYNLEEDEFKSNYPLGYEYLLQFKTHLIKLKIKFKTNKKYWYALNRPRQDKWFKQERIITPQISYGCNMTLDKKQNYHNAKVYSFLVKKEYGVDVDYFFAILNSKVVWFFLKSTGDVLRGGYFTFTTEYLKLFHIPYTANIITKTEISTTVNMLLQETNQLNNISSEFIHRIITSFSIEKNLKLLQTFYLFSWNELVSKIPELTKINPQKQDEWEMYFENHKKSIINLQLSIDKLEHKINYLVYDLYNFTKEEIEEIEKNYPK
jgi:hypothetical protein